MVIYWENRGFLSYIINRKRLNLLFLPGDYCLRCDVINLDGYRGMIFLPIWRIKTRLIYPLRYLCNSMLSFFMDRLPRFNVLNYFENIRAHKDEPIDASQEIHTNNFSSFDELPHEVIFEIVKYIGNPINLMKTNKIFLDIVAPVIYRELNLLWVFTKTRKLRANDLNYLRYGPDPSRRNSQVPTNDPFSIYERYRKSRKYTYEILDTDVDQDEYIEVQSYTFDEDEYPKITSRIPKVVYKYEAINSLLQNVIKNPNSMFRKYIKTLCVDVSIFDGFGSIFMSPVKEALKKLKEQENPQCFMKAIANGPNFFVDTGCDVFSRCRWMYPNSLLKAAHYRKLEDILDKFPVQVYWKELAAIGILYHFHFNDKRKHFMEINNEKDLNDFNPFKEWNIRSELQDIDTNSDIDYSEASSPPNETSIYIDAHYLQKGVKIKNRRFATTEVIHETLLDLINSVSSNELFGDADCSLTISGVLDYNIEPNLKSPWHLFNDLEKVSPSLIVLNKPKLDNHSC